MGLGSGVSQEQQAKLAQQAANQIYQVGVQALPTGPGIGPEFSEISGQQQQQAADAQATDLGQESTYAIQTSLMQAAQNDYAVTKQQASQNAQFSTSGVTLAGSPLGILNETQELGAQVSNQIRLQGQLQSQLYSDQGLAMLRQGSAAAFAGQANALQDQFSYESQKSQAMASLYGAQVQGSLAAAQKGAAGATSIASAGALGLGAIFANPTGQSIITGVAQGAAAALGGI